MPFLRVHCHAAVVADVLVAAGGDVEEGCLSAVRVADEGDADDVVPLLCQTGHLQIQRGDLVAVHVADGREVLLGVNGGLGLLLADHVDQSGFGAAQRNLVAKYFIFNRIFKRSVQHDRNTLSGDEAHLDEPLPEPPVAVHLGDDSDLSSLQFRKFHIPCLPQTSDCLL